MTGPVDPVDPVLPVGPVDPVVPVLPVEPVEPAFPASPVGPVMPTKLGHERYWNDPVPPVTDKKLPVFDVKVSVRMEYDVSVEMVPTSEERLSIVPRPGHLMKGVRTSLAST